MLYILIRYIIRYRLKVVRTNIKKSFPQKCEKDREDIVNQYYKYLCRIFRESVMLLYISPNKIKQRFVIKNIELLDEIAQNGQNTIVVFGHYGNWEWISTTPLWSDKFIVSTIYRRIKSERVDRLYQKIRSRFGTECIEKKQTLRALLNYEKSNTRYALGVLADQQPSLKNAHYWIKFLNQPTAVISGWATIARKLNCAVVYLDMTPKEHGHYEVSFETITLTPRNMSELELVEIYMRKLEEKICENPSNWLWSHKRWKHTPPKDFAL